MFGENKIQVLCLGCHARLYKVDKKSKIDKTMICSKCKRMIVYRVFTGETEVKPIPKRTCSSGMTFI